MFILHKFSLKLIFPQHSLSSYTQIDPSSISNSTPNVIKTVTAVSTHPDILTVTLPYLIDYLAVILTSTSTRSTPLWQVAKSLSSSLLTIVSGTIGEDECKRLMGGEDGVLVRLVCLCVRTSVQSVEYSGVLKDLSKLVWCYTLAAADE